MRIVILNTDYAEFLVWLYTQHPGLERQPYAEQMGARNASLFGVADFYSRHLRPLGHEAYDIHVNNEFMQRAWAREHCLKLSPGSEWRFRLRRGLVPWCGRVRNERWAYETLAAQIDHYKPDVIINHSLLHVRGDFLREVKPSLRLLVGQHAATEVEITDELRCYDLILSSFPLTLERFRHAGMRAELNRLGFEPAVLSFLRDGGRRFPVVFVGSFFSVHASRRAWLESVCEGCPEIRVWGPSREQFSQDSRIRGHYVGSAWGREMFQVLRDAKIALNHHGDVAAYANNMRLYEATGVGTLLITDWKENLGELFEPGLEVVTYRSPDECVELVLHFLRQEDEREAIALRGQQRTLRDHTYQRRAEELVEILKRYA